MPRQDLSLHDQLGGTHQSLQRRGSHEESPGATSNGEYEMGADCRSGYLTTLNRDQAMAAHQVPAEGSVPFLHTIAPFEKRDIIHPGHPPGAQFPHPSLPGSIPQNSSRRHQPPRRQEPLGSRNDLRGLKYHILHMHPAASSPIDSHHTYAAQDLDVSNDEFCSTPSHYHSGPPAAARKLQRFPRRLSALGHLRRRRPPGAGAEMPESRLKETVYGWANSHPMHIGDKRRQGQSSAEERDRREHRMERMS